MRFSASLARGILPILIAAPLAAANAGDWDDCKAASRNPDRSIAGCTRLIDGGQQSLHFRAVAYANRAGAYVNKKDNDRAIADASEAIQLDPGLALAYTNRAAAYLNKGDSDRAIADTTEAIGFDPLYAPGYADRAAAYLKKGDNDHVIADASKAIDLDPGNALVYATRAGAYLGKGDNDRVIADASKAIRLDPAIAFAYANRAAAYANQAATGGGNADRDRAIADYSEVIRLEPRDMSAYFNRGRAELLNHALPSALVDFEHAGQLAPGFSYAALWLDIASQRSKLPSRLPQAVARFDMTAWPAPLIRLFMGQMTPVAVLAAAEHPDATTRTGQICEANFYSGEYTLRAGDTTEATRLFRLAANGCPKSFAEWEGANAELKALGAVP
jgi:tetratricopeptide (TPR) repeat protein